METAELYGDKAEVIFQAHNWPHWREKDASLKDFLLETASIYKFINDQTLLYLNQGFKMEEAAEKLRLPYALEHNWNLKPYYGTPSHDAKAVYQRYLGWYDANPIHLNPLPPEERAKAMAGYFSRFLSGEKLKDSLSTDLEDGKYRTVADFAYQIYLAGGAGDCDGETAKGLCVQALRQLAYTSESGSWRNCYLSGAWELENGKARVYASMGTDLEFVMDIEEGGGSTCFHIYIRNGVILYYQYKQEETSTTIPDNICHFSVTKKDLILLLPPSMDKALDERIRGLNVGDKGARYLNLIFYNLVNLKNDRYQAFDIVTPHDREFLTRSGKRVNLREKTKACIRMLEGHLKSISGFGDYDLLFFDEKGNDEWIEEDGFYQLLVEEAQVVEDTAFFAPTPVGRGKAWMNNLGIGPDGFFCKYEYAQVLGSCYRQNFNCDVIIENDIMHLSDNDARAWSELSGKIFPEPVFKFFKNGNVPSIPQNNTVFGRQLAYALYLLYRELYLQYEDGDILGSETERIARLKETRNPHSL